MAQIDLKTIKRIEKGKNVLHEKVQTTYTVFEDYGGKYVQLDTYGKSSREVPGKISQSIQIDREAAIYLVKLLVNEFHLSLTIK